MLCQGEPAQAIRLTFDHKPEDPEETSRIEALGGTVTNGRVLGQLGVSRALGDTSYEPYISQVLCYVVCIVPDMPYVVCIVPDMP